MALMRTIQIFVSSPSDVEPERRRVEFVAERLNGLYAGVARFETIRWENQFYSAHETAQPQIPEAADCDIVIGILWARLGSELPPSFGLLPDSREPYPSGTAYEILSAMWKRRDREKEQEREQKAEPGVSKAVSPDIYVFQKKAPPFPPPADEKELALFDKQWNLLKGFLQRWFRSDQGHLLAAFHSFHSTDEFEQLIEKLLRDWLRERVLGGRKVSWSIETKGSPFRGLRAFDAEHAPVFFGRSRDITRATDRLRLAAQAPAAEAEEAGSPPAAATMTEPPVEQGSAFLLVIGPSGVGKSSFVRAGVATRLTTPGVVKEVDVWRVAVMHPSDSASPIDALAQALYRTAGSVEQGALFAALPELGEGDCPSPSDLAKVLRTASLSSQPIMRALERVEEITKRKGGFNRNVRADLLLVVDQLDELFAADLDEPARLQFSGALAELVATNRVWLIATLRASLYENFLESEAFETLRGRSVTYDLTSPSPSDLADIVRKPAEMANLAFERDSSGVSLDERLLEDATGPDTLPLLQFTLQQLFEEKRNIDGKVCLTYEAYDAIGGVDGAIDQAAENAIEACSVAEIEALPRLLRQLVVPVRDAGEGGASRSVVTIRPVLSTEARSSAGAKKLVHALVGARILTESTEGKTETIRIAHQRVLQSWKRANEVVQKNIDFLRIRSEVEDQLQRWKQRGRKSELLLRHGLPLAEAEDIAGRYKDELSAESLNFINDSSRHARLRQRLTGAAAVAFAAISVVATVFWNQAQRNLDAATSAISALIETTSNVVRPIAELDQVESLINQAREAMNRFSTMSEDPRVALQRARTLLLLSEIDWDRGNISDMRQEAQRAFNILTQLAGGEDLEVRHQRARSERLLGLSYWQVNDRVSASQHFQMGIAEIEDLLRLNVSEGISWRWYRSLADLNEAAGDNLLYRYNDPKAALAAFDDCYSQRLHLRETGHTGPAFENEIGWAANKHGDVAVRLGNRDEAMKWFTLARHTIGGIGENLWDDLKWPEHLAVIDVNIGILLRRQEKFDEAESTFKSAVNLLDRIVRRDPKNLARLNFLSWANFNRGEALLRWAIKSRDSERLQQAHQVLTFSFSQTKDLASRAPGNAEWQLALIRQHAFVVAAEAMINEWTGAYASAAAAYRAAADLLISGFLPVIDKYPNPNFLGSTIEFLEWSALSAKKAGQIGKAKEELNSALGIVDANQAVLGKTNTASWQEKLGADLEGLAN
jgi:tetratricopeptide (TPR) repeat protein